MDTVFFVASKLLGAALRIDSWVVLALAGVVIALMAHRRRAALRISGATLAILLLVGFLPLGAVLLQPIERQYPAAPPLAQVDGIIVLGGGEDLRASAYWDQVQLGAGAERYTAALALARRFPEATLLFTGGSGALRDVGLSEADVAQRFFAAQGLDGTRLLLEGQSRNTAENARLSRELAAPSPEEVWVLVTSAFHMPRAMRSFETAGWDGLVAYPVDFRTAGFMDAVGWNLARNIEIFNLALRERVGQLAYRLTGQ